MAAPKTQTDLQHQQLRLVLQAVGKSQWGKYLGLQALLSKLPNKGADAHSAFVQDTEVTSHTNFIRALKGIVGIDENYVSEEIDTLLKPETLTKEPLAGICPTPFNDGVLPVTQMQVSRMKARLQKEISDLAKRFKPKKIESVFYFYSNPLRNIAGEGLTPLCGLDVLLAEPEKRMFSTAPTPLPDPYELQAAGHSPKQRMHSYIGLLDKQGTHIEALWGTGRIYSDMALELSQKMPHKRLIEYCPNLKYCFIDSRSVSPNQAGFADLFPKMEIPSFGVFYSSYGLFGHAIDERTPEYFEPVLDAGAFFEFVPLQGIDEASGRLKPSHQRLWVGNIENGHEYLLIVSNVAGLIAYNTGMIVRVASTDPLRIKIVGRSQHLNGLYERLGTDQINELLTSFNTAISRAYKCYVRDYMVGDHADRGQAVWALELSVDPKSIPPQVLKSLANRLHSELAKINRHYLKAFAQAGVVSPVVTFLPPGIFLQSSTYPLPHIDPTPDAHHVRKLMNFAGDRQVKLRVAKLNS